MSIPAAVTELNKEIAALEKTIAETQRKHAHVVAVRDMLLQGENGVTEIVAAGGKRGRKPGAGKKTVATRVLEKTAVAKKGLSVQKKAAPKKRVMSAEGRARIIAAQKKRWATKKAAEKKA